jgi:ubiquinone/menaquinone biosynthesis C-methylase UbiE
MTMMPYYERIAKQWHAMTGARGGAFKDHVLNELVLRRIPGIAGLAILEVGAGNGHFMRLVLRRFSGQIPSRIVITDHSPALLNIARRSFRIPDAEYQLVDVRAPFPFAKESFDLILANMIFNELPTPILRPALRECQRVLSPGGRLLATVIHPAFVKSLARRGQLKPYSRGVYTMPASEGLRLPVAPRNLKAYQAALENAGFQFRSEEAHSRHRVLSEKPGLRRAGNAPIALLLECEKLPCP